MLQILFFCMLFLQSGLSDCAAASRAFSQQNLQAMAQSEVESKEQVAIRQEFIETQGRHADEYLSFLELPYEIEEIIRGYLYAPEMFRMSMGKTYTFRKQGSINAFVANSRTVSYAIFEMADHSLEVYLLGVNGAIFLRSLRGGHSFPVTAVAVSPNNRFLYSKAKKQETDNEFEDKLWNLQTGEILPTNDQGEMIDQAELVMQGDDVVLFVGTSLPDLHQRRGMHMIRMYPLTGPVLFKGENPSDNFNISSFRVTLFEATEQLLTLQELDNAQLFVASDKRFGIYDRPTDTFIPLATPVGLVAGRMSRTHKNRCFLLSQWCLETLELDAAKEQARIIHRQKFSKIRFKKPSTAILSDDGTMCAIITAFDLEVWYLPTETLVYRQARTGNKAIPTGKLSFVQDRVVMVDDKDFSVRCFIKNPDLERYVDMLPIQNLEFMKSMVQKYGQEETLSVLSKRERQQFAVLPTAVQKRLQAQCMLEPLTELPAKNRAIIDSIMRQAEQLKDVRPTLALTSKQDKVWQEIPEAVRKQLSERFEVKRYTQWPWFKFWGSAAAACIATDLIYAKASAKPAWIQRSGFYILWCLSQATTQAKRLFW